MPDTTTQMLGCGLDYVVELNYVARRDPVSDEPLPAPIWKKRGTLSGVTKVVWDRTYNAVAGATVEVGDLSGSSTCIDLISQIVPWIYELRISRDGEAVFEGPIIDNPQVTGVNKMTIIAADVCKWFERVSVKTALAYSDDDPVAIAADVIRDNLSNQYARPVDYPLILPYLYTRMMGEAVDYAADADRRPVIDVLDDMTDFGMVYAAVGRRVVLAPVADENSAIRGRLSTSDFTTGVTVHYDGEDTATYGWAISGDDPARIVGTGVIGSAYGVHDAVIDVAKGMSTASMRKAAARLTAGRRTPPLKVDMPGTALLRPTAAIDIANLRPGSSRIDLFLSEKDLIRERGIRQAMLITDVSVTWVPRLEQVKVALKPLGAVTTELHCVMPDSRGRAPRIAIQIRRRAEERARRRRVNGVATVAAFTDAGTTIEAGAARTLTGGSNG